MAGPWNRWKASTALCLLPLGLTLLALGLVGTGVVDRSVRWKSESVAVFVVVLGSVVVSLSVLPLLAFAWEVVLVKFCLPRTRSSPRARPPPQPPRLAPSRDPLRSSPIWTSSRSGLRDPVRQPPPARPPSSPGSANPVFEEASPHRLLLLLSSLRTTALDLPPSYEMDLPPPYEVAVQKPQGGLMGSSGSEVCRNSKEMMVVCRFDPGKALTPGSKGGEASYIPCSEDGSDLARQNDSHLGTESGYSQNNRTGDGDRVRAPSAAGKFRFLGVGRGAGVDCSVRGQVRNEEEAKQFLARALLAIRASMQPPMPETLAQRLAREGELKDRGPPVIYLLRKNHVVRDEKHRVARCEYGSRGIDTGVEKVLLVVGATGAGKSSLINAMANYVYGVEWEDPFRFRLVDEDTGRSQAESQTKWITAYVLHRREGSRIPYTLTIVDTPGFGDTDGLQADEDLKGQIQHFFSSESALGEDHLDGVGMVAQASCARLTKTQRYVFESVLSVFGVDVKERIFAMATFADNQTPAVLEAMKVAEVPFSQDYKFNNSALYAAPAEGGDFDRAFWKMGVTNLKRFFRDLGETQPVSLKLTKEVLNERQKLNATLQGLQAQFDLGVGKLEEIRNELKVLRERESDIACNKSFQYVLEVQRSRKVDLVGEHVTNCLVCSFTCHYPCRTRETERKRECSAMDGAGNCTACPKHCAWSQHAANTYRFERFTEVETRTSQALLDRYQKSLAGKSKSETLLQRARNDFKQARKNVRDTLSRVHEIQRRLETIALRPHLTDTTEYLELLIKTEERENKPGHMQRLRYLHAALKREKLGRQVKEGQDPFEEYEELLQEEEEEERDVEENVQLLFQLLDLLSGLPEESTGPKEGDYDVFFDFGDEEIWRECLGEPRSIVRFADPNRSREITDRALRQAASE
ncbi:unnamed protein product [Darwinula stevensoni]|uniref:Septin-type G domain-containing protein n=1 Tax=Darwinula stevensoni TaxID=69355 RepID=A0A7R9FQU7_9CRUS|nr:unnamed protein product [Darwinula stevensoni]CAG0900397.1 unnamed protein product [Darwinula stevensoni]